MAKSTTSKTKPKAAAANEQSKARRERQVRYEENLKAQGRVRRTIMVPVEHLEDWEKTKKRALQKWAKLAKD